MKGVSKQPADNNNDGKMISANAMGSCGLWQCFQNLFPKTSQPIKPSKISFAQKQKKNEANRATVKPSNKEAISTHFSIIFSRLLKTLTLPVGCYSFCFLCTQINTKLQVKIIYKKTKKKTQKYFVSLRLRTISE